MLQARGLGVEIWIHDKQIYVRVPCLDAPSPPWDKQHYDILIAIPALYDDAELDGFYLGLPYKHSDREHERVNGPIVAIREREWRLVSWHYLDGKKWVKGRDTLESHIVHCKGFFLARGVRA